MGIFSAIFWSIIVGLLYVLFMRNLIMKRDDYSINKKVIDRILTLPQLHILFTFIVYGGMNLLEPEVPGDNIINDILDNTFVGDVVGLFSDVDTSPNYQLIAFIDKIKQNIQFFVFIMAILILIETIGLVERKVNRYVIECIAVICSVSPIIVLLKMVDIAEYVLMQSKVYGIFNFFGGVLDLSSYYRVFLMIMYIALPINHILYHKALSTYYAPINNNTVSVKGKIYMAVSFVGFLLFVGKGLLSPKMEESPSVNNNIVTEQENAITEKNSGDGKSDFFKELLAETDEAKSEKIDERLSVVKSEKNLISTEGVWVYYWDKESQSPYDLCFYKQNLETGDTIKMDIPIDLGLSSVNDIFFRDDSTFLIIGNNGWNSYMNSDYAISFNKEINTFSLLLSSKEIVRVENYLEVTALDMITLGEFSYQNNYSLYKEYYDFYGNKIRGNSVKDKGFIGKYAITMSIHSLDGNITGWYKYEGHTNYMTLKGTIQENNSFVFTEYNDKGESFGTFYGYADFNQHKLSGIWKNGDSQLNFIIGEEQINANDDYQSKLKDLIIYWNELHTNQLISSTSLECLYAPEVLFYGQTLSSKDCVARIIQTMRKYDDFSQALIGDIEYTIMDNNFIRCDFTKKVQTDGRYTNYPAYLIFGKEGNGWSIVTESDLQTDAYFERNK